MRLWSFVCLLLVAFVWAQTAPPPASAPSAGAQSAPPTPATAPNVSAPEPPKVNPDDPVITIKGFCKDSSLQGDACKTVITKAEFDKLADTLQPGMAPAMRRQLATRYSQVLTMSSEAEKRSLDKTPHFEESMHFARMQILAQELSKNLQTEAGNISDQDVQDYYQKNAQNYEQATLIKIFVPHSKREAPPETPATTTSKAGSSGVASKSTAKAGSSAAAAKKLSPEEEEKAGEEAMKREALLVRDRLIKGEDPDKLQKDAFVAAGLPGNPPPTKMDKVRRPTLPADQQAVMELKPGDVSDVISDASGNFVYKLVSKEPMPVDSVKGEIHNLLASQRYREAMQHYQGGTELNEAYFGPGRGPGMPMPPRAKPSAPAKDNDPD